MILQTSTHLSTCWAYIEIANSDTKGLAKKSKLVLKIDFFFLQNINIRDDGLGVIDSIGCSDNENIKYI